MRAKAVTARPQLRVSLIVEGLLSHLEIESFWLMLPWSKAFCPE
jgi:hypothetical protein